MDKEDSSIPVEYGLRVWQGACQAGWYCSEGHTAIHGMSVLGLQYGTLIDTDLRGRNATCTHKHWLYGHPKVQQV